MDEPLSNLDAKLRAQTRTELIKLHQRLGVTTIYVTHDQVEAMTMGHRIAVMRGGKLQQCDTPMKIYAEPANVFVAGFIGSPAMNLIPATVRADTTGAILDLGGFTLGVPEHLKERLLPYKDQEITYGIRPEDLHTADMSPIQADGGNTIKAMVDVAEPMGATTSAYVTIGTLTLVGSFDGKVVIQPGQEVSLVVDLSKTHAFDCATEEAIF